MRFLRLLIPILVLATGCKQELGDRCQIDSDCDEGRCSSDNICRLDVTGSVNADAGAADGAIDASLEEDEVDAAPPGTPDATTFDAPPDEPDAAEADAAEADAG